MCTRCVSVCLCVHTFIIQYKHYTSQIFFNEITPDHFFSKKSNWCMSHVFTEPAISCTHHRPMFTKKHEMNVISTTMNGGLGDR